MDREGISLGEVIFFIFDLIIDVLMVGTLANILANALYDHFWLGRPFNYQQIPILVLLASIAALILLTLQATSILCAWRQRREKRIELILPLRVTKRNAEMLKLSTPGYHVLSYAQQAWKSILAENEEELEEFLSAWRSKEKKFPLHPTVWRRLYDLAWYIVVQYLGRYGRASLEPSGRYSGPWYIDLKREEKRLKDFPDGLNNSYFLRPRKRFARDRFAFPKGLRIKEVSKVRRDSIGELFDLSLKSSWGEVTIHISPYISYVNKRYSYEGRIFCQSIPQELIKNLTLLRIKIELKATFGWWPFWCIYLPDYRNFYLWVTGLFTYLEEKLSWRYFAYGEVKA